MKKKKGFTLVELLAVIVIISMFAVVSVVTVGRIFSTSKEKVNKVTFDSIKETAVMYVKEYKEDNDNWYNVYNEDNNKVGDSYVCTTIQTLINYGYLKSDLYDIEKDEPIDPSTTIKVSRNEALVVGSEVSFDDGSCDMPAPTLEIKINDGTKLNTSTFVDTKSYEDVNLYYPSVSYTITYDVGNGGLQKVNYYYKTLDDSKTHTILKQDNYTGGSFESSISKSLKNIQICGEIVNKNDVSSGEVCSKTLNILKQKRVTISADSTSSGNISGSKEINYPMIVIASAYVSDGNIELSTIGHASNKTLIEYELSNATPERISKTYTSTVSIPQSTRSASVGGSRYYTCPNGGSLNSSNQCVNSNYPVTGWNVRECWGGQWYSSKKSSDVKCNSGFTKVFSYCGSPTPGTSCSPNGSTATATCYATCVWNTYSATYVDNTYYYCANSSDRRSGGTCYYCSRGTYNSTSGKCEYTQSYNYYYNYWKYEGEIIYYYV